MKYTKTIIVIGILLVSLAILIQGLGQALVPLTLSAVLAYLLFPAIQKLEGWFIPRQVAVLTVFSVALLLIGFMGIWLVPTLLDESKQFMLELPNNVNKALSNLEIWSQNQAFPFKFNKQKMLELIKTQASHFSLDTFLILTHALKTWFSNVAHTLITLMNIFLFPVFFFYIINDYEEIGDQLKFLIPQAWERPCLRFVADANEILQGYIRGQLMVATLLATIYAIALSVIGIRFGFVIGIITGLLSIIPYVGLSIGIGITSIILLSTHVSHLQIIAVIATFGGVQAFENFFLTPKLVGNKLGLSTLDTLIILIIGGNLGGLFGMFIAIPLAGLLKQNVKKWQSQLRTL